MVEGIAFIFERKIALRSFGWTKLVRGAVCVEPAPAAGVHHHLLVPLNRVELRVELKGEADRLDAEVVQLRLPRQPDKPDILAISVARQVLRVDNPPIHVVFVSGIPVKVGVELLHPLAVHPQVGCITASLL